MFSAAFATAMLLCYMVTKDMFFIAIGVLSIFLGLLKAYQKKENKKENESVNRKSEKQYVTHEIFNVRIDISEYDEPVAIIAKRVDDKITVVKTYKEHEAMLIYELLEGKVDMFK